MIFFRRERHTWTVRAAGILRSDWTVAEQGRAHLRLTEHTAAVAGALSAGVDVPRLSLHKVLSTRSQTHGCLAQLWLMGTGLF